MTWTGPALSAVSLGCFGVALFHLVCIVRPELGEPSPAWRHGLFVGVNLLLAAGFLKRPRWFSWPLVALTLQQLISHGTDLLEAQRRTPPRLDVQSLAVLVTFPLLLLLWTLHRQHRRLPEIARR